MADGGSSRTTAGTDRRRAAPFPRTLVRKSLQWASQAVARTSFGTITSVATDEPLVALTFDDGPDPDWTPQVLDVLGAHGAKATFFIVGESAERHPDVLRRTHDEGHALGNHGQHHSSFPFLTSAERRAELRACAGALSPYPQARRLFRPPHLDQDFASRYDAWRLGYDVIACNRHANDWKDRSTAEIERDLNEALGAGDIILLHDVLFDQRERSRSAMIAALDAMLRRHAGRFRFVTVPVLLAAGRPRREMALKRPRQPRQVRGGAP